MAKQFIRVSKTYATKNKIQLLILQKLQTLDHTLTLTHVQASREIKKQYDEALKQYNGKAAVPELKTFNIDDNTSRYQVEDVIIIDIHTIINDLS